MSQPARRHRSRTPARRHPLLGAVLVFMGVISFPSAPTQGSSLGAYLPLAILVSGLGILVLSIWHWMEGTDRYRGCKSVDPGKCARCGYDLFGNASGRCPECGTPVGSSS